MAKPPPAGPSSDIEGNDRDFHVGDPPTDPEQGGAGERHDAEKQSKARPPQTSEKPGGR